MTPRKLLWELRWWARWWVRYFPRLAYRRLTLCRKVHTGPMYDGLVCLACGAPWFAAEHLGADR